MLQADLAQLWEEHTSHEFSTRDTEATLATMVEDAYVNHVPVLTGGVGKDALRLFYSVDFIPSMPPDTKLTPISRTVGAEQPRTGRILCGVCYACAEGKPVQDHAVRRRL